MFYRISSIPKYESDSKVQFVIDAVYAFAHALDALKKDICPRYKGVCDAMTWYDGGEFYKKYLLKVDFNGKKTCMYLLKEMTILFVGSYPVTYESFTLSRISSVHRKCMNKCTLPFFH